MLVCATVAFGSDFVAIKMDLSDRVFTAKRDWDPCYLRYIFSQDFYEFRNLWLNGVGDEDMIKATENTEPYSPIVEDISMDDDSLCQAVKQIERE